MNKSFILAGMTVLFLVVRCSSPAVKNEHSASTIIRNVRLFDGQTLTTSVDVLLVGEKISRVDRNISDVPNASVVDGTGKTLLPGLIDSHVHVLKRDDLKQMLNFGVTTACDLGGDPELDQRLKIELKSGALIGAEIVFAGNIATTKGGHGTEYGPAPTLETPSEAEGFVSARIREGSDFIKIIYDDGRGYTPGLFKSISRSTLNALVKAAHAHGKLAIVHAQSSSEALDVINSGADGLAHVFGDILPSREMKEMASSHKIWLIPTLSVYAAMSERIKSGTSSPFRPEIPPNATKMLFEAHVPILAGTDAPNAGLAYGSSLHDELELLVKAGIPPIEVLRSATSVPAKAFGLNDRGQIAPELIADVVLVDGDPTVDIRATRRVVALWKRGRLLRQ